MTSSVYLSNSSTFSPVDVTIVCLHSQVRPLSRVSDCAVDRFTGHVLRNADHIMICELRSVAGDVLELSK